jgi:PAS domain S-box-containing protein
MIWQYTPYLAPLCIATAISAALVLFAWRRRQTPAAIWVILLLLAVSIWSLMDAAELSSASREYALIWAKLQYLGIVNLTLPWLGLTFTYTDRSAWLTWRRMLLLMIIPLISLALVATNEQHGLIWSVVEWDTSGPLKMLRFSHGAWFWLLVAYTYGVLLAGMLPLIQALRRARGLYRQQVAVLLAGATLPWIGNALYVSGASPFPAIDLTPFAFTLTGVAATWGIFRSRILDIVPIARDRVIEEMADGVLVLDEHGRIVDLNQSARRMLGCTAESPIGWPIGRLTSAPPSLIERCLSTARLTDPVVIGAGATQQSLDVRVAPMYDQRGRLSGQLVMWHDISERIRIEQSVYRQARDLALIDQVRVVLAQETNLSELFRVVVERIAATFGYTLVGLYIVEGEILKLQHQVGYGTVIESIPISQGVSGQVVRTGQPVLLTDVESNPAFLGAIAGIVSEICVPLFDQGRVVGTLNIESTQGVRLSEDDLRLLLVLGQSISIAIERTRLHDELALSEERFRTLVSNVPGAIYRCANDDDLTVEFISDAITEISGYPVADFIGSYGRTLSSIIHPDDRERVLQEDAHDLYSLEYRIVHAEAGVRWVREIGQKVRDADGKVRCLDGVIFNITERKRAEEALERALDAAETANRAKSTFLATTSHELRTPLTGILGYTELIEIAAREYGYTNILADLTQVRAAGRHLLDLISDVLDFSKIEAGKLALTLAPFELSTLIADVIATVQPLVERNRNSLSVDCPDNPGVMVADAIRVRQVLLNLLGNAAKFTEDGAITLEVRRVAAGSGNGTPSAGEQIEFRVTDTGIGMQPEQLQLLFQPFVQLDQGRTRMYGGTGLGLALSQRFCRMMGGEITVRSCPGKGSTFTACLPAVVGDSAA